MRILQTGALLTALMMLSASEARAEFPWQGAQIQTVINGEAPLSLLEGRLSVFGSATHFWVPSGDANFVFTYMGPKLKAADWFWVAVPLLGVAANWTEDGGDALIVSLWSGMSFLDGRLTVFLEGERYFNPDQQDLYGYQSVDYAIYGPLNLGVQAEEVNQLATFGPHIGITKGPWHGEVQYHAGVQEDNRGHTVRIFTGLSF